MSDGAIRARKPRPQSHRRRAIARRYPMLLSGIPEVTVPVQADNGIPVYHQYTIRVQRRDDVQRFLKDRGIATMIYYPTPLHLQPLFAGYGYQAGDLPEAERAAQEVLSLPMYPELTDEQIIRVTNTLKEAMRQTGEASD